MVGVFEKRDGREGGGVSMSETQPRFFAPLRVILLFSSIGGTRRDLKGRVGEGGCKLCLRLDPPSTKWVKYYSAVAFVPPLKFHYLVAVAC